jgi:RNA polymerase sigma-70 factor (ECF subfamily)
MDATARHEFEQTALPLLDNMYGVALRMTRNPTEAEDLVQDAMVRAYRFWSSFTPGTSIKAWLFTILRNTFINRYHKKNRRRSFTNDLQAQLDTLGQGAALAAPNSEPPGPEEAASARLTRARILEALESVPEDYRVAVTLADLQGLSYKEIAEIMECPIGTVMSRIYRGRRQLHKLLYEHAVETGLVQPEPSEEDSPVSLNEYKQTKRVKRGAT